MSPQRIQLRRTKGWRKPEGAVVVARPSKWGNPWTIAECSNYAESGRDLAASFFRSAMEDRLWEERNGEETHEIAGFYPSLDEIRAELAGHDLACWCPLDQPCHADVLIEIANLYVNDGVWHGGTGMSGARDGWLVAAQWTSVTCLLANAVWSVAAAMPAWAMVIDWAGFVYVLVIAVVMTRQAEL